MPSKSPLSTGNSAIIPDFDIQELNLLAARGLIRMFDQEKQLFCHRLVRTDRGLIREGFSPRYTIMTLLGLREFELNGGSTDFDTEAIYQSLVRDTSWIEGAGDLGLMLWLIASFDPERLRDFSHTVSLECALDNYADARQARTMELAWFLAGLAHAASLSSAIASELIDIATETYRRLQANQGKYGFFGHIDESKSVAGIFRGRIGSFADQVYPIYAISKFAVAFGIDQALDSAVHCGSAVCAAQGKLGQWWWLYDSRTGRTSSRYPVYSVHQHGMAPMGLFALEEAAGRSFRENIYRGLRWIYGANEFGLDMRDLDERLIWRCVLPEDKGKKYWDSAVSLIRSPREDAYIGPLRILFEDRPYELGWLLFAFARFNAAEKVVHN
jgi:hypothetical protein